MNYLYYYLYITFPTVSRQEITELFRTEIFKLGPGVHDVDRAKSTLPFSKANQCEFSLESERHIAFRILFRGNLVKAK